MRKLLASDETKQKGFQRSRDQIGNFNVYTKNSKPQDHVRPIDKGKLKEDKVANAITSG